MDENFASMRSLIQVFDQTLYNAIQQSGDFSHFYFCYRYVRTLFWALNLGAFPSFIPGAHLEV